MERETGKALAAPPALRGVVRAFSEDAPRGGVLFVLEADDPPAVEGVRGDPLNAAVGD